MHGSLIHYTQEFLQILRRRNYITPKHFLDYLNTYVQLLNEKDALIQRQIVRLSDGIQKINEASAQIDVLSLEVEGQKDKVLISAKKCDDVLANIQTCEFSIILMFVKNHFPYSFSY